MKWWRQLRGAMRASFHVFLVALPIAIMRTSDGQVLRAFCGVFLVLALGLLVRAAFIYLPGFDPWFRVPWHGPLRWRRMALTFDDGPNGTYTEGVLDLLSRYGARATFFMVGQSVERQPELARRVAAAGHAVGSHTYSHQKLSKVPFAHAANEIDRGHEALARAGLPDHGLFRAPHGLKTFAVVRHLERRRLRLIAWTAGVHDTDRSPGATIAARARRWVRPGAILLLHDGKDGHERGPLLEALEEILRLARQRGIALVSVPELLEWR